MKISIEPVGPVQKKIICEIPSERVGEELDKAYRAFQPRARLKGFRSGKVPRPLLERHFGEQVASEVSALLVQESYARAIQEHALPVVNQPQIVTEKLVSGSPFRYSATIEVSPDVTVTDYEGLEVEKQVRTVGHKDVEDALARLADSLAQLRPVENRNSVEQGDMVTLDYVAFHNGRPVAGLQGKGQLVEVGKETILPGFQEHLVGLRREETAQFVLPFPQAEGATSENEQMLTFHVTVHDLAQKEIPELDDEFAKDHGECATLEELREKVRNNLQTAADRQAEGQMRDALVAQIVARNPFEVPPSLVREQMRQILIEAGIQRPEDDLAAGEAKLPASLREEIAARARSQVQTVFMLDALAKQLSLTVSEEEVRQRIAELASAGVESQQRIEALYAKDENRRALEGRLLRDKALRAVVEKARVKTVERAVAGGEEKD